MRGEPGAQKASSFAIAKPLAGGTVWQRSIALNTDSGVIIHTASSTAMRGEPAVEKAAAFTVAKPLASGTVWQSSITLSIECGMVINTVAIRDRGVGSHTHQTILQGIYQIDGTCVLSPLPCSLQVAQQLCCNLGIVQALREGSWPVFHQVCEFRFRKV